MRLRCLLNRHELYAVDWRMIIPYVENDPTDYHKAYQLGRGSGFWSPIRRRIECRHCDWHQDTLYVPAYNLPKGARELMEERS